MMKQEQQRIELHLADPEKLESVVAFVERLSGEKLTPEEVEELRRTIDKSHRDL